MDNICFEVKVLEMYFPTICSSTFTDLINREKTQSLGKTALDKSAWIKARQYVLAEFENREYFNIWFISPDGKST